MKKIKYVSLFFRIIFCCIFVGVIAVQTTGWIIAPVSGPFNVIPEAYFPYLITPMMPNIKLLGFMVMLVPNLLILATLYCLIKLFRCYEQYEIFSANTVYYISRAGYALLLEQLIRPVSEFILGFVLTYKNPPGLRLASITLSDSNMMIVLIALVIILISWIMAEGFKLSEEQQLTV